MGLRAPPLHIHSHIFLCSCLSLASGLIAIWHNIPSTFLAHDIFRAETLSHFFFSYHPIVGDPLLFQYGK